MELNFKTCSLDDIDLLSEVARETYRATFEDMNSAETMTSYLKSAFNKEQLKSEVSNPDSRILFLYRNDKLAGYLKINEYDAQTEFQEKTGLEIERIYLRKEFQGQGLGSMLLDKAISIANEQNKEYVWLGVWKYNKKAISFYEHMGFTKTGSHYFIMGKEKQEDYIMRKELS